MIFVTVLQWHFLLLRITFKSSCDMQMKPLNCFKQSSKSALIMLWNLIPVYVLSPPSCTVGYSASLCQATRQFLSKRVRFALSNTEIERGSGWLSCHCHHHRISSGLKFGKNVLLENETQRSLFLCSFQLGLSCDPFFALKLLNAVSPGWNLHLFIYSFQKGIYWAPAVC